MLRSVIGQIRSFFIRTRVMERVVEIPVERVVEVPVDRVVEKRVEVPAPPTRREYWVVHSHKPTVVQTGVAIGETEFAALNSVFALHNERVQFAGGGRYRAHTDGAGQRVWTRIDRASRSTTGDRARHRARRLADGHGGIVGE